MAHLTIDFFSNCLRRTVQFQMIIPGDFCNTWQIEQKRKGKRMKTLFLLHGYTGAAENWVPDNLSTLYNFAIVMPSRRERLLGRWSGYRTSVWSLYRRGTAGLHP